MTIRPILGSKTIIFLAIVLVLFVGLPHLHRVLNNYANCSFWLAGLGGHSDPESVFEDYYDVRRTHWPKWTPDGAHIVFAIETDVSITRNLYNFRPTTSIHVVAADGSSLQTITDGAGGYDIHHSPSVSPDGSRVAYSTYNHVNDDKRYFEIETSALDGSDRQRLTRETGFDVPLEWLPDGRIAFTRDAVSRCAHDFSDRGIYTMKPDGSEVRKIVPLMRMDHVVSWTWSPDGRALAYVLSEYDPVSKSRQRVLMVAETSDSDLPSPVARVIHWLKSLIPFAIGLGDPGRTRLLVGSEFIGHPAWTPDARHIAFAKREDRGLKLYTIGHNGSGLQEVVGPDYASIGGSRVSWSPFQSGSQVMFSPSKPVYLAHVDASNYRIVSNQPVRRDGFYMSWSPDISRVAVVVPLATDIALYTVERDGLSLRVLATRNDNGLLESASPEERHPANITSCSSGVVVPDPESNPDLVGDCEALVEMVGPLAVLGLNWNADTPIAEWEGLTLEDPTQETSPPSVLHSPLRVRGVSLHNRGLKGTFPLSVTRLTGIRVLDLSDNQMFGTIPAELGRLTDLRVLNLHHSERTYLNGPIPPELGNLTNLRELSLSGQFTDPIPPELGRLANLETLTLYGLFDSPIPPDLGNLSALKTLSLMNCQLTGPIPPELGNLRSLEAMDLSSNELSGSIPPGLGNLRLLETLDLSSNEFSGPIPPELGNLTNLKTLDLGYNNLSGFIPPELGDLAALEFLKISASLRDLSGCIPSALRGQAEIDSPFDFCDQ